MGERGGGEDGKWRNWFTVLSFVPISPITRKKRAEERESSIPKVCTSGSSLCESADGTISQKNPHCHLTCTHTHTDQTTHHTHTMKHRLICKHSAANMYTQHTKTHTHILKQLSTQSQVNLVAAPPHHHHTDGHKRT